ncbi:MAG: hypothetical protein K6A28_00640 [Bacteroidales bacterium]|nr:hypothetical protein [Bacteroidales bacterium]
MKTFKRTLLSLFILASLFQSCSTDVDLYADYKDITVVYGLLDFTKDTNYIKINKAFLGPGNAYDIALIDDSCNYPGKLNCRIIESRANAGSTLYTQTRVLEVDTITIHNKDLGLFYAPDQLVYYTKDRIYNNTQYQKFKYELEIDRGDTILRASTDIVGGYGFSIPQAVLNFSSNTPSSMIKWSACPNAAIYDVAIDFRYFELWDGRDTVARSLTIELGAFPEAALNYEQGTYSISYNNSILFQELALDLGADTLKTNVERLVFEPSLTIRLSAGGEELYNFISVNGPSSSIVQNIPEYTNVAGGYGVFSSRTSISKRVKLSSSTFNELIGRENWRFRQSR